MPARRSAWVIASAASSRGTPPGDDASDVDAPERDGELPGAYRDLNGQIRVSEPTAAALAKRQRPIGLSQPVVADAHDHFPR
jgi:hypothetical protein